MLLKGTNLYYEIQNRVVVIKSGQPMSVQDSFERSNSERSREGFSGWDVTGSNGSFERNNDRGCHGNFRRFRITIPKRDSVTLLFSFVGMKTKEVKWRDKQN